MPTPSPIEYADASPQVRSVYDDIKKTRNVPDVNNFWKFLARDPATLKRTWESVKEVISRAELDERAARPRLGSPGGARRGDLPPQREPLDARLDQGARVEVGLDRAPRDEGHAVAGPDRARNRLLESELELDAEVAQPHARARSSSSII